MKKFINRYSAFLMLAVMIIFGIPVTAKAQEGFTYEFEENSKSLFVFNLDDGNVVYSMNADEVRPMASLTKMMTYIVAVENIPDIENTLVTVSDQINSDLAGTESSLAGLYPGEELTVLQLLNMMMIPSGNDAALALQYYYDENIAGAGTDASQSAFIALMNAKAEELGCTNTHFVNPHGLHDEEHYSSARDLAKIVQYAVTLPYFTEITNTTTYTLPATNKYSEEREINATNKMLLPDYEDGLYYYEYANGIKTGSHNEAGYCIAASATHENDTYVVVAMGSPMLSESGEYVSYHGEMVDAATLFDWAFSQLSRRTVQSSGDVLGEVQIQYARQDTLQAVAANDVAFILPNDVETSELEIAIELPETMEAPVVQGDILGKITYSYEGEQLGETDLIAAESIERSKLVEFIEFCKILLTSVWFWLAIAFVVVFVVGIKISDHKKRKRRRRKNKEK